jgi:hypothetical protein
MIQMAPLILLAASIFMIWGGIVLPPSKRRILAADSFASKVLSEAEASLYNAETSRVQVWDAFSELFLDTSWDEAELDRLAHIIAASPFSFEELGHILTAEVVPVCGSNLFQWPGGEWSGFAPHWLIPKCREQQNRNPFRSRGHSDRVSMSVHLLALTPASEAYFLLYRSQSLRPITNRPTT